MPSVLNGMKRIAVFASGSGSNVKNILEFFSSRSTVEVAYVVSNKREAGALDHAAAYGVEQLVIDNSFGLGEKMIWDVLMSNKVDGVVLAGFLRKIPLELISAFEGKIINIHPSLLPKFGGKGMYGKYVHEAVIAAKEAESGITIHKVNLEYDKGAILFQTSCKVDKYETVQSLEAKIRELEQAYFPVTIEKVYADGV